MIFFWIAAGYLVSAAAFYSYIVATAQDEPQEQAGDVVDMAEWKRRRDEGGRKAA